MTFLVYSILDVASLNIANAVRSIADFEESAPISIYKHYTSDYADMVEVNSELVDADFIDKIVKTDLVIFLSRHASAEGVTSFTTHAEGNWSDKAEFGGKPKALSMASPINMIALLRAMRETNTTEIPVMYEATHHGPLLDTPSLFVELGGGRKVLGDVKLAGIIARSIVAMLSDDCHEYEKIAIGIGGTHYPEKFTKLALEGRYAFAHIMPRYCIGNVDMLEKAIERSDSKVELAVIEWKSIKVADRDKIIKRLEELGFGYERV